MQGWNGRAMFGSSYTYTGMLNCISCVVKREGLRGLYKGLGISLLKSIVVAAISFSAYEQCCNVFIRIYSHVTWGLFDYMAQEYLMYSLSYLQVPSLWSCWVYMFILYDCHCLVHDATLTWTNYRIYIWLFVLYMQRNYAKWE